MTKKDCNEMGVQEDIANANGTTTHKGNKKDKKKDKKKMDNMMASNSTMNSTTTEHGKKGKMMLNGMKGNGTMKAHKDAGKMESKKDKENKSATQNATTMPDAV